MKIELKNKKLTDEEFFGMRQEVLAQWPTGREVEDLDGGISYCKSLPAYRNFHRRQKAMEEAGLIDLELAAGRTTIGETLKMIAFSEAMEPGSWCIYTDSYTRKVNFAKAQEAIDRSRSEKKSLLNGLPLVNYGVKECRRITESTNTPIRLNATDHDCRLACEIALASGWAGSSSHNLQEVIQHAKDFPLETRIIYSQYTDRLAGYYSEHGVPIEVIAPGILSGWDAPGFKLAVNILQALLCAEQGVQSICMDYSITLNLIQDAALISVSRKLTREYMERMGHRDIHLPHQTIPWQGDWPRDPDRAAAVVAWSAAAGILAGVERLKLKAVTEAKQTADAEGTFASIRIAKQMIQMMGLQRLEKSQKLAEEEEMLELEVRAVLDAVLDLGQGDAAVGMVRAVEAGVLDTFFSPWKPLKQDVVVVRDADGAMRYLRHGNVPLPRRVAQYHQEKLEARARAEQTRVGIDMLINDATRVSRDFAAIPLTVS
jgi:methylaspartate mutase epsilon subunit